jgi:hypothetical protein
MTDLQRECWRLAKICLYNELWFTLIRVEYWKISIIELFLIKLIPAVKCDDSNLFSVEQELLTFPKHLSSWHLWLVIVLSVLLRSIYGLALPLRYLQNFLGSKLKCLIFNICEVIILQYCIIALMTRKNFHHDTYYIISSPTKIVTIFIPDGNICNHIYQTFKLTAEEILEIPKR